MAHPNHFPAFDRNSESTFPTDPLKGLIKRLSQAFGPAGSEEAVRTLIRDECRPLADEVRVDGMGNLIIRKRGAGGGTRRKLMLAAHMDEVGLMVTHVDEKGFARFAALGPLRHLSLLGQRCLFANGTIGVIGREEKRAKPNELEPDRFYIDTGATGDKTANVAVGDSAVLLGAFVDSGTRLIGKAFDDRLGCAVLIDTLRQIKKSPNDLYFVFTVQQQVGARGATTSTFGIQPDFALVVDVTAAGDTPEAETNSIALGKGPAVKVKDPGILVSPLVRDALVEAAREARSPYQFEVAAAGTTDAGALQITREGVHAGALSIPLRYMHTPAEMAEMSDVQNAIKLLLAVLARPMPVNA